MALTQSAVVTKILSGGFAQVVVDRGTACSGNCGSCGGSCGVGSGNTVVAENPLSFRPGQKVVIESGTGKVIGAAVIAYILPLLFLITGYTVPALLGRPEGICVLCAFLALVPGVGLIVLMQKRKKPLRYIITGQDTDNQKS